MISLRETVQESLTLVHKVMAMERKMSRCLDIKLTITEWIKNILEILFEFMFSKMTERKLNLVKNFNPSGL